MEKVQPASLPRPVYNFRLERLPEEIDSHLYQTVGQDAIGLVAQALDVPLYRKTIEGTAVDQGPEYGGRTANTSGGVEGDETEDLFDLLSTVKVRDNGQHAVVHLITFRRTTPIFLLSQLVRSCQITNEFASNTRQSRSTLP